MDLDPLPRRRNSDAVGRQIALDDADSESLASADIDSDYSDSQE